MGYWQSAPPPKPSGVSQSWHSRRDSDGSSAPRMVALPPIDRNNRPTADLRKGRGKTLLRQGIPPCPCPSLPPSDYSPGNATMFPNHIKKTPSTTALLAGRINTDARITQLRSNWASGLTVNRGWRQKQIPNVLLFCQGNLRKAWARLTSPLRLYMRKKRGGAGVGKTRTGERGEADCVLLAAAAMAVAIAG